MLNAVSLPSPIVAPKGNVFPINRPFWSIFFKLWVANAIFGAFWKQLHGRGLLALIGICAVGLIWSEKVHYTVDVGWSWPTLASGFARVGFSFSWAFFSRSCIRRASSA